MADQRLGPGLAMRMASMRDYENIEVNIFLKGEFSRESIMANAVSMTDEVAVAPSPREVAETLREQCRNDQKDLIDMLVDAKDSVGFTDDEISTSAVESSITSYWINNAVSAKVSGEMLKGILKRDDVAFVEVERFVDVEKLLDAKRSKATKKKLYSKRKPAKKKAAKKQTKKSTSRPSDAQLEMTTSGGLEVPGAADATTNTWSVERINAPKVWQVGVDGKGVVVAVIDTGVNYTHPDLKPNMWKGGSSFPNHGFNYAENDNDPKDRHGHGTACAGQVAGTGKLGERTGVAPKATIMAIRVGGREKNFWDGMQFAITHGADVISMSMSWKFPNSPNYPGWRRVCETILAAGLLHANSIGNQGNRLSSFPIPFNIATPGNCPPPRLHPLQSPQGGISSSISCGATDDLDQLANFSGRGPAAWESTPFTDYPWQAGTKPGLIKPDICAPGPGTTSCNWKYTGPSGPDGPYRPFGGTSAATPHIGGCLALLAHACKNAGQPIVPARIQEAIENTAVRVAGQNVDKENHYGAGRVDIYGAYNYGLTRGWW